MKRLRPNLGVSKKSQDNRPPPPPATALLLSADQLKWNKFAKKTEMEQICKIKLKWNKFAKKWPAHNDQNLISSFMNLRIGCIFIGFSTLRQNQMIYYSPIENVNINLGD